MIGRIVGNAAPRLGSVVLTFVVASVAAGRRFTSNATWRRAGWAILAGVAPVGPLPVGATPWTAGAVQLLVLVGLMAVEAASVATVTERIARGRRHREPRGRWAIPPP